MHFVLTDIHGCFREAADLLNVMAKIADENPGPHTLINLGDNIDRGPHSRAVLELFKELTVSKKPFDRLIMLPGNHEQVMLDVAEEIEEMILAGNTISFIPGGNTILGEWAGDNLGGLETFNSYMKKNGHFDLPGFRRHIEFIKEFFTLYHQEGEFLFVHAGIDPRVENVADLTQQKPQAMLWIRDVFLNSWQDYPWKVVHGHSPTDYLLPELLHNRINIDTGCAFSGRLTGLVIADINDKRSTRFVTNQGV